MEGELTLPSLFPRYRLERSSKDDWMNKYYLQTVITAACACNG